MPTKNRHVHVLKFTFRHPTLTQPVILLSFWMYIYPQEKEPGKESSQKEAREGVNARAKTPRGDHDRCDRKAKNLLASDRFINFRFCDVHTIVHHVVVDLTQTFQNLFGF